MARTKCIVAISAATVPCKNGRSVVTCSSSAPLLAGMCDRAAGGPVWPDVVEVCLKPGL